MIEQHPEGKSEPDYKRVVIDVCVNVCGREKRLDGQLTS
jgi:hypothetical protein